MVSSVSASVGEPLIFVLEQSSVGQQRRKKAGIPHAEFPLGRKRGLAAGRREVLHQHLFEGRSSASPVVHCLDSPPRQDALESTVGNRKKLTATNSIVVMRLTYRYM